MCIICNCENVGDEFLTEFAKAQHHMEKATALMLRCKNKADPKHKRQYDAAHKHMTRVKRDWNRTEELRENPV